MPEPSNVLVVQTAFLGDLILTLPLAQALRKTFPLAQIDFLVVPKTASVLANHPAIDDVLIFDKRGGDAGIRGFLRQVRTIRKRNYDTAILPHRSIRSAALVRMAQIPRRIGFNTSAGRILFTDVVKYESLVHEVDRNLNLLNAFKVFYERPRIPELFPSDADREAVDSLLQAGHHEPGEALIGIAPGTVWNTKRWIPERYADLVGRLISRGFWVVILGGGDDRRLLPLGESPRVLNATGRLTILQSAELIRRCRVLVCNDSAPMHLAVAVRTPVVAIFGATIPEFGFAPIGKNDVVLETKGLACRPCTSHGGDVCPVKTFDCMMRISAPQVLEAVNKILGKSNRESWQKN